MAAGALAGSGCPDCDSEWPWPGSSPGTSHWHSGTAFTGTPSQAGIQVVWQVLPVSLRGFLATACQWAACSCGGAGQLERRVTVCPGLDSDRLPGSLTSDLLRRAPAGGCRLPSKPEAQELHQCRPDRVLRSNPPPAGGAEAATVTGPPAAAGALIHYRSPVPLSDWQWVDRHPPGEACHLGGVSQATPGRTWATGLPPSPLPPLPPHPLLTSLSGLLARGYACYVRTGSLFPHRDLWGRP